MPGWLPMLLRLVVGCTSSPVKYRPSCMGKVDGALPPVCDSLLEIVHGIAPQIPLAAQVAHLAAPILHAAGQVLPSCEARP